jgi:membrane protease YdiL (CAAX protease family)
MNEGPITIAGTAEREPVARWRRILRFPLVALVIAVGLFVGANAIGLVLDKLLLPPMAKDATAITKGFVALLLTLLTYKLLIVRLGDEPRDDLRASGAIRQLAIGLLFGLILFSTIVGIAALIDVYNIVGPGGTSELLVTLVTAAIVPGIMEELLFRGILFRWIEAFGGSWAALAITSALFGLGHIFNPNATALSSFAIAVEAGVLLGGAYMLTRSLWMPIGLHAAWNFTQGFIYDVPVSGLDQHGLVEAELSGPVLLSGGAFGLEASLIAMIAATSVGVWLVMRAVKQGEVVQPWWVRRRAARAEAASQAT